MRLRFLQMEDAPLMLEWMHDESVVRNLQTNFAAKTLADCEAFIQSCEDTSQNLHMAIVDDSDTYMGTVSLKHIDPQRKEAEFAITMRACAMGKGLSSYGMGEIIRIGLEDMGLNKVYWCVSPENARAIRFYNKNGYLRVPASEVNPVGYSEDQIQEYIWYVARKKPMK